MKAFIRNERNNYHHGTHDVKKFFFLLDYKARNL